VSCTATAGGVCGGSANNRTVTFPGLGPGASATITLVATISASTANNTTIFNGSSVAYAALPDPNPGNNTSVALVIVSTDPVLQFSERAPVVNEGDGLKTITVTRAGDTTKAVSVDYATGGTAYALCNLANGKAAQNCDYLLSSGRLNFAAGETSKTFQIVIIDDSIVEGDETLTMALFNPSAGAIIWPGPTATLTITDNDVAQSATNPIDGNRFFVQQQYYDFLNRVPDPGGFDYWTGQLNNCGTDRQCLHDRRIGVSDAFFFEPEFQESGAYVYRIYKAAFGAVPTYAAFMPDRSRVIGGAQLDASKTAFALTFVQRASFVAAYPQTMTGDQFVTALLQKVKDTSGVDLTGQQAALTALYDGTDNGRAAILRQVADNQSLIDAEYRRSFVLMEYFGYLRRDPDLEGFNFWLGQVNRYPVRDVGIQHAMVCSFITSAEYQLRFGSAVTHTNQECPQ
jgi:hypothetical protein